MWGEKKYHDLGALEGPVRLKYAEILNCTPPNDPQQRSAYYDRLFEQFPQPGTPDFAVLVHLLRDPLDKTNKWKNPELWEAYALRENLRLSMKLEEAFSPLCERLSEAVFDNYKNPDDVKEQEKSAAPVELLYSDNAIRYASLVPLVLVDRDIIRRCCEEKDEGDWTEEEKKLREQVKVFAYQNKIEKPYTKVVLDALQALEDDGFAEKYRALAPEAREQIDLITGSQNRNTLKFISKGYAFETKKFDRYIFDPQSSLKAEIPTPNVMVPVGQYGSEFASKLYRAISIFLECAQNSIKAEAQAVDEEYAALIHHHTGRHNSLQTMMESILSLKDAIVLCMAVMNPERDTPDDFFKKVINNDLPTKLARIVPMGTVSPLVLSGRFMPYLLEEDDGALRLSCPARQSFKEGRGRVKTGIKEEMGRRVIVNASDELRTPQGQYAAYSVELNVNPTKDRAVGCPVSRKRADQEASGITQLSRALLHIYELLSKKSA